MTRRHGVAPVVLAAALLAGPCRANPCTAVHRTLDADQKAALASTVAAQLHAPTVDLFDVFQRGGWRMVYADAHTGDTTVLFFAGDPATHHYAKQWSGAARRTETIALRDWARTTLPGLPPRLADCFGWYVSQGRSR